MGLVVCQIGDLLNSRAEEPRHNVFTRLLGLTHTYFSERGNVTAISHEVLMK